MKLVVSVVLFFCAMFTACSPMQVAGNGSEVTNGIVASKAGPVDSAMVIAFPVDYIPCSSGPIKPETTFTNNNGVFRIDLNDASWNLLIYNQTQQLGAFAERRKGESAMGTILIDSLGNIACTAPILTIDSTRVAYVGMAGSPFYSKVITNRPFLINRVPAYAYRISIWIYSSRASAQPILLEDNVITGTKVMPGMTSSIIINQ
jgi:hypothetical protein